MLYHCFIIQVIILDPAETNTQLQCLMSLTLQLINSYIAPPDMLHDKLMSVSCVAPPAAVEVWTVEIHLNRLSAGGERSVQHQDHTLYIRLTLWLAAVGLSLTSHWS